MFLDTKGVISRTLSKNKQYDVYNENVVRSCATVG